MGKYIVIILFVFFAFLAGLLGFIYFQGASSTTPKIKNAKVEIENKGNLEMLLTDIGWYEASTFTMLSGVTVSINEISGIEVVYSDRKQPFLQQGDASLNVFASVDAKIIDSKLILTIHVDPKRLTEEGDKNWWINHQVIRALNKMINPNVADEVLQEKDRGLYDKYKDKIDLWQINFKKA